MFAEGISLFTAVGFAGVFVFANFNFDGEMEGCRTCPDNSTFDLIKFKLYLGNGLYQTAKSIADLKIVPDKEIHLFIPSDYSANYYIAMKEALHKAYDDKSFNYIFVEWTTKKNGDEDPSFKKKIQIGKAIGLELNKLKVRKQRTVDRIATQGKGGILIGPIAVTYNSKLKRVVLLDPFSDMLKLGAPERLTRNTAEVVEVVHTTANEFGFSKPIGHRDFYPNGGLSPQPECAEKKTHYYCSTRISVNYYFRALEGRKLGCFTGKTCSDFQTYLDGGCDSNVAASLYNNLPNTIRGTFYLTTQ